jgi:regulator of replication initiation timing
MTCYHRIICMQIPDVNLDAITDPAARQMIGQLLNLIETLSAENQTLRAENQHLRDELVRLKGGSGKPDVKPPTPVPPPLDHSSEAQRAQDRHPGAHPHRTLCG